MEINTLIKKTAKIAGATCIAVGAVAIVTGKAAINAVTEGAKYLKDTVQKILDEEPQAEAPAAEPAPEEATEAPAEAVTAEEAPAEAAEEAPAEAEPQAD